MLISRTDRGYSRSSRVRNLSIIFAVLIVLFFLLRSIMQPVLLGGASWISNIFTNKTIEKLQLENDELKNKLSLIESLSINTSSTEELLKIGITDFVRASVIIKKMNSVYGSVYINKGSLDGIQVDNIVFASGLHPVGSVAGVDEKFSRIELFTASNKKLGGLLRYSSSSEEVIELQGDGAYGFVATVPSNSSIKNGDNIYFNQDPDFVIGQVVAIGLNENENNKIVRIKSFYSVAGTASLYIQK